MAGSTRRRFGRILLVGVCLLATVVASSADDGVIEINQVRALAGGVTEEDAPGFPVTIAESGSYRLTGNLDLSGEAEPANTTAIDIRRPADVVSLDLNGFSILGTTRCGDPPFMCEPTGAGDGIRSQNGVLVRVSNGIVTGMGASGIRLGGGGTVFDARASHNGQCGICILGSPGIVVGCTADSNGLDGIGVLNGVVRENTSRDNARIGIVVRAASVVRNNGANGNLLGGIATTEATIGSVVLGNSVHANGGTGLALAPSSGFADNVASANAGLQVLGGIEMDPNACNGRVPCR